METKLWASPWGFCRCGSWSYEDVVKGITKREKWEHTKKKERRRKRRKRRKDKEEERRDREAYFMFSETEDLWSWQRSGKLVNGLVFVKAKA